MGFKRKLAVFLALQSLCVELAAEEVRQLGVVSEERQASCAKAFADLPTELKTSQVDLADKDALTRFRSQLRAYDDQCLEHLNGLRDETVTSVKAVLGFFFLTQGASTDLVCAGFRITDHLVATAAHCLWWRGALIDPTRLQFRMLSKPELSFQPTGGAQQADIEDERLISDQQDFAVLKVDTSTVALGVPTNFYRERLPYSDGGYLLIPGLNVFEYLADTLDLSNRLVNSVRVSKGRSCFRHRVDGLEDVSDHCVFSICQTLEVMSGAPIFGYDSVQQTIYVGGMHLRDGLLGDDPRVRSSRECGIQPSYNVGITLPKAIIAQTGH